MKIFEQIVVTLALVLTPLAPATALESKPAVKNTDSVAQDRAIKTEAAASMRAFVPTANSPSSFMFVQMEAQEQVPTPPTEGAGEKKSPGGETPPKSVLPPFLQPGPNSEPALKAASWTFNDLKVAATRIEKTAANLKDRTGKLEPGMKGAVQQKEALAEFKRLLDLQRKHLKIVLDMETEVMGDFQIYAGAAERAPSAFLAAGDVLSKKADNAKGKLSKEVYAGMAADARKWATALKREADGLPATEVKLRTTFELTRELARLIEDLDIFIGLIPETERKAQLQAIMDNFQANLDNVNNTAMILRDISRAATSGIPPSPPLGNEEKK